VTLSVHNCGRPLSNGDKERIFVPYSRGDVAEYSGRKGWGIGLALVRGTAEAHGGWVRVRSRPGEGTTFTVDVPRDARPRVPLGKGGTTPTAGALPLPP
jgi:signal transduction histidine kinase